MATRTRTRVGQDRLARRSIACVADLHAACARRGLPCECPCHALAEAAARASREGLTYTAALDLDAGAGRVPLMCW